MYQILENDLVIMSLKTTNHKVIVVTPAYNEEKTICWVVLQSLKTVNAVIVIDDGSTDSTAEIAKKCGAIVIRHKNNLGKGAALRTGFNEALKRKATIVVTLDADGQHDPREISKVIQPIIDNKADIVIGSRFLGKSQKMDMPLYRRIGNRILNFFTFLPGRNDNVGGITDSQSGFRAYTSEVLRELEIKSDNIGVDSQVLMELAKKNHRIMEVPISCQYKGLETSTYHPVKHTLSVIYSILTYITEDKPLYFLGIPAIIFLLISIGLFLHLLDIFNRTRYFSIEIALMGVSALLIGLMLAITSLILFAIGRVALKIIQKNVDYYTFEEYKKEAER